MSKSPTRVQRLVRLNQFREEQASGALREAIAHQLRALEAHDSATAAVDDLGEWKLRGQGAAGLDLAFYSAALDLESSAMTHAEEMKQAHIVSKQQSARAQDALIDAACAMRVSENRGKREHALAELAREKRSFDQISDVWLNNREESHD